MPRTLAWRGSPRHVATWEARYLDTVAPLGEARKLADGRYAAAA